MKPNKWIVLGVSLALLFSFIGVVLFFKNGSQGGISKGQTQLAGLNKQTADDDLKPYSNALLSGQALLDAKTNLNETKRKVNFYYANLGGTGVVPLYISPNGAPRFSVPTGITAPTLPTNLQAVAGAAPAVPTSAQVTNTMTTNSPDYIDPNATYRSVVYMDTATNSIVQILAVQQQ